MKRLFDIMGKDRTVSDHREQIEQIQKEEANRKGRELLKQGTNGQYDLSYQELVALTVTDGLSGSNNLTGFTHAYIKTAADMKKMITTGKDEIILALADYDLSRDQTICYYLPGFFLNSKC